MNDKILEMFFDIKRWTYAIDKGVGKHINKAHLYQLTKPETRAAMCAGMPRSWRYATSAWCSNGTTSNRSMLGAECRWG